MNTFDVTKNTAMTKNIWANVVLTMCKGCAPRIFGLALAERKIHLAQFLGNQQQSNKDNKGNCKNQEPHIRTKKDGSFFNI